MTVLVVCRSFYGHGLKQESTHRIDLQTGACRGTTIGPP